MSKKPIKNLIISGSILGLLILILLLTKDTKEDSILHIVGVVSELIFISILLIGPPLGFLAFLINFEDKKFWQCFFIFKSCS